MNGKSAGITLIFLCIHTQSVAHHSTASFFHLDQRMRLEGVVEAFHPQNPHGYIVFSVVGESGAAEIWRAEMPTWSGLRRVHGWTSEDLSPGDKITIEGAPPRAGRENVMRADDIIMPDGWTRHLFRNPETGKYRKATPPADMPDADTSIPITSALAAYTGEHSSGVPDISGTWQPNSGRTLDPRDIPAPGFDIRKVTLTDAARLALDSRKPGEDPVLECERPTLVNTMNGLLPIQISQERERVVIRTEPWNTERIIHISQNDFPENGYSHSKDGYSIGRYEGDTLVIDTAHISAGYNIVGTEGPSHSNQLQFTERYRRSDDGQRLEAEFTATDPLTFTHPVSWQRHFRFAAEQGLHFEECRPTP